MDISCARARVFRLRNLSPCVLNFEQVFVSYEISLKLSKKVTDRYNLRKKVLCKRYIDFWKSELEIMIDYGSQCLEEYWRWLRYGNLKCWLLVSEDFKTLVKLEDLFSRGCWTFKWMKYQNDGAVENEKEFQHQITISTQSLKSLWPWASAGSLRSWSILE